MDVSCPKCQTTKYRNPKMKLMVSKCGHSLCENCLENLFSKGLGLCPTCKTELKKSNFRQQMYEDPFIELEIDVRKRLLRDFNMKEQDFETLDAYNDYLEMVETYIFNLTNKINVEETERKIAEYRQANKDTIAQNRGKLSYDEMCLEHLLEKERELENLRKRAYEQETLADQEAKQRVRNDLMSALLNPSANVNQVLERSIKDLAATREKQVDPIVPNMLKDDQEILLSLSNDQKQQRLFEYVPPRFDHQGPRIPDRIDLGQYGYLDNVRQESTDERAGGYTNVYPCTRAIQEAFDMLYFVKDSSFPRVKTEPIDSTEQMQF